MVAVSKMLRSAAQLPLSTKEFFHAFVKIWPPTARSQHSELLNVGLAISGGVDSMALAALCSQLHHADLKNFAEEEQFGFGKRQRLSFRAFIVDHGARVGSDEEAFLVSKNLEQIGIPAHILEIQWPDSFKLMELSNFESVARTRRYQALGKACYKYGIEPLLTAHHKDDQTETVMMRLLRGARGVNLQGMRSSSDIPECYGIYGVNRSGNISYQVKQDQDGASLVRGIQPIPIPMESGGIHLYRPLLHFSKSHLKATCIHLNTPWFEDKTNQNPTVTQRNAIRYLYQKNLMPKALSKPAILSLAHRMQEKHETDEMLAKSIFSQLCIEEINWSAGTLKIRFPKIGSGADSKELRNQEKRIVAILLRSLIYFVTPSENVALSDLGTACEALFPGLFSEHMPELRQSSGRNQVTSFTTAGVQFTRTALAISQPGHVLLQGTARELDQDFVWVLSRQAYKKSSEELPTIWILPQSPSFGLTNASLKAKYWSMWHLFDGRFWIRIANITEWPVVVRPFCESHMANFSACPKVIHSLDEGGRCISKDISKEGFMRLMKTKFPGAIRYTLPAILALKQGQETVVALPTIGIAAAGRREEGLDWEIRYKCVDEVKHLAQFLSKKPLQQEH